MNVIIHISDLHVNLYLDEDEVPRTEINSYLTTNLSTDDSFFFIDTFIKKIEDVKALQFPDAEFILLITGDITNSGEELEFKSAKSFIKKIMTKLNISKEKCLLIPGDHDVNRRSLKNYLIDNPDKNSHLLNKVKLNYFGKFYKDLKGNEFEFDKIIFDHLIIDNQVVILAINSNYKINQRGGEGYIVVQQFQKELDLLKTELGSNMHYICCWHHNLTANFENSNSGQWFKENRVHLLAEVSSQQIKLILTGNEHTSGAKKIKIEINTSDSGVFSSSNSNSSFKLYPVKFEESGILLENISYNLIVTDSNDNPFYWNKVENISAEQVNDFEILVKNTEVILDVETLPEMINFLPAASILDNSAISQLQTPMILTKPHVQNIEDSDKLYNIIKDKKLFHSGHFHWSNTSRAHNWIDISKLLEDKDDLLFLKNAIIKIIESNNLAEDCSAIIGLGYEGNLIASKASIKYDVIYSYLPYSYRYKDHHDYENHLNLKNNDGKFKNVIIITDVVNDGRTIRKLIGKREKSFFEKVKKITVISLFYTGDKKSVTLNILNSSSDANFDYTNDETVNNIEFYSIKNLRVEKCPYGAEYVNECLIYKDDLSCVNLFYDEKK